LPPLCPRLSPSCWSGLAAVVLSLPPLPPLSPCRVPRAAGRLQSLLVGVFSLVYSQCHGSNGLL
jgi:hypothetical protein